jgi:hypothetical protein
MGVLPSGRHMVCVEFEYVIVVACWYGKGMTILNSVFLWMALSISLVHTRGCGTHPVRAWTLCRTSTERPCVTHAYSVADWLSSEAVLLLQAISSLCTCYIRRCCCYSCIGGGSWNHGTTLKWGELYNSTMSTGQWRLGVLVRPGHTACLE